MRGRFERYLGGRRPRLDFPGGRNVSLPLSSQPLSCHHGPLQQDPAITAARIQRSKGKMSSPGEEGIEDEQSEGHNCSPSSSSLISSLPRIDSSKFIDRNVDVGLGCRMDMWKWNVIPWRRVCAEAKLREDAERTAPPTYIDGRPKRWRKEAQRMHDKGFAHPDSAPNVFTLDEWRAMDSSNRQSFSKYGVKSKSPLQFPPCTDSEEVSIISTSSNDSGSGLSSSLISRLSPRDDYYCGDLMYPTNSGLLDPALFDQNGSLLRGDALDAAQARLDLEDNRVPVDVQNQQQTSNGREGDVDEPLDGELASRDGWGWKVSLRMRAEKHYLLDDLLQPTSTSLPFSLICTP